MAGDLSKQGEGKGVSILVIFLIVGLVIVVAVNFSFRRAGGRKSTETEGKGVGESLIVSWRFDEGSGQSVKSDSGDLMGIVTGATWIDGVRGKALSFDGAGAIVEMGQTSIKKIGTLKYGTVSLWFKYNNLGTTGILPLLYFGEDNDVGTISNVVIAIGHGDAANSKLYYTLYDNTNEPVLEFSSNNNLEKNTWYHLAITNGPQGNTGYINGVEMIDRRYHFGSAADIRFFNTIPKKDLFRLGYGWFGRESKFHHFKGAIDEVSFYNRALTASEIAELALRAK